MFKACKKIIHQFCTINRPLEFPAIGVVAGILTSTLLGDRRGLVAAIGLVGPSAVWVIGYLNLVHLQGFDGTDPGDLTRGEIVEQVWRLSFLCVISGFRS